MEEILKISGVCLFAALLCSVIERQDHALAIAAGTLACALALITCIRAIRPAALFFEELTQLSELDADCFEPLIKTVAIGIVTQISSAVCADCGQRSMAKTVEVCGVCAGVLLGMPLLRAALEMIRSMMGQ